RTGALVTGFAWQTPPGARPNRGLAPEFFGTTAGVFRSERPGLVAGAAEQSVAEMNGCPCAAGPYRDTARGTEPGLQAPWQIFQIRLRVGLSRSYHPRLRQLRDSGAPCLPALSPSACRL